MATPALHGAFPFACQAFGCYSKDSKPTHALFKDVQGYLNRFTRAVGFAPLVVDGVLGPATATALQAVIGAMATSGSAAQALAISLRVANVASSPETIARFANEVLAFLKLAASEAKLPAVAAPSTALAPAVSSSLPTTFPGFAVKRDRRWPYYVAGAAAGAVVLVGGYFVLRAKPSASVAGDQPLKQEPSTPGERIRQRAKVTWEELYRFSEPAAEEAREQAGLPEVFSWSSMPLKKAQSLIVASRIRLLEAQG